MKCVFSKFSVFKKKAYHQSGPPGYWILRTHHIDLQPASFTLRCRNITVTLQSHDFSSPNQTSTVEAVGAATQSTRSYTSTAQSHGLGTNPQWEESALLLDANLRRNFGFNPQCHTNKKALRIFPMCVSWIILPTWQAGVAGISGDTRQRTCFACNRHMLLVELLDVGVAWCRGSRTLTSSLQRRKKNMSKLKLNSNRNLVIRPPRFWSCFPICMNRCKG